MPAPETSAVKSGTPQKGANSTAGSPRIVIKYPPESDMQVIFGKNIEIESKGEESIENQ